jgi:hypothetical protein
VLRNRRVKKLILILFSLWVMWTQTPLASRCDASAVAHACRCCTGCDGACGCVSPGDQQQSPLPLAAPSTSIQTELLFPAAPASALVLPFADPAENLLRSPAADVCSAVPLFRRDCALLI